jgi:rhodanese-related sulfurtransferase
MEQISVSALRDWLADAARPNPRLVDVREPWEVEICRLPDAAHMPMGSVPGRLEELDPEAELVVYCHHGGRSAQVAMFLERRGFRRVFNLAGGIHAWAQQVDPAMPSY